VALIDFQVIFAPADQPELIRQKDPALKSAPPEEWVRWLSGPFRRYTPHYRDVRNVAGDIARDTAGLQPNVPCSYLVPSLGRPLLYLGCIPRGSNGVEALQMGAIASGVPC